MTATRRKASPAPPGTQRALAMKDAMEDVIDEIDREIKPAAKPECSVLGCPCSSATEKS